MSNMLVFKEPGEKIYLKHPTVDQLIDENSTGEFVVTLT